jgi:hypothetical protein
MSRSEMTADRLEQLIAESFGVAEGMAEDKTSADAVLQIRALRQVVEAARALVSTPGREDRLRAHRTMMLASALGKLDAVEASDANKDGDAK